MMNWINKKRNKKGFTLVELVVVIAILGILAAIAVPKLTSLRHDAKVKAEGATAVSIVNAARIQETNTGNLVKAGPVVSVKDDEGKETKAGAILESYMKVPESPKYEISGGGSTSYIVTWTSEAVGYTEQKYEEGTEFTTNAGVKKLD